MRLLKSNHRESRGLGCLNARQTVFDHEAVVSRKPQSCERLEVDLRVRLYRRNVFVREHEVKDVAQQNFRTDHGIEVAVDVDIGAARGRGKHQALARRL